MSQRNPSPLISKLRDLLLQRKFKPTLRFEDEIARRTQPPPDLPTGPADKLSANYYCTRDARRLVTPPEVVYSGNAAIAAGDMKKAIGSGEKGATDSASKVMPPRPPSMPRA